MRFFNLPEKSRSIVGFTLIEMMVAVSVVAILATIGFATYTQSQKFARDSKRKTEIKQVQTALNLYYGDYKKYPGWLSSGSSGGCTSMSALYTACNSGKTSGNNPWIVGLDTNYINLMPRDPLGTDTTGDPATTSGGVGYGYRVYDMTSVGSPSTCPKGQAQVYLLYVKLENTNDPDKLGNKGYVWCGDQNLLTGPSAFSPDLFVIGSYL